MVDISLFFVPAVVEKEREEGRRDKDEVEEEEEMNVARERE